MACYRFDAMYVLVLLGLGLVFLVWSGELRRKVHRFWHTWANWYAVDDARREKLPTTARVLHLLALEEGLAVAEVGAGPGFFTFRIARAVGTRGVVYATDDNFMIVPALRWYAFRHRYRNVKAIHVRFDDLGLAPASVDRLLLANVYRFESCQRDIIRHFFTQAHSALRTGGLLIMYYDEVRKGAHCHEPEPRFGACPDPDLEELIQSAANLFLVQSVERLIPGSATAERDPGYILVLRKSALEGRPTA